MANPSPFSQPFRKCVWSACIGFVLALGACSSPRGSDADPPTPDEIRKDEKPSFPPPCRPANSAPPSTNHLVVYLDASASMRGYVLDSEETVFIQTLRELRTLDSNLRDVRVRLVREKEVTAPQSADEVLTRRSALPSDYAGNNDLALGVRAFKESVIPSDKRPPQMCVLVTDGVQSSRSDQIAVGNAMADLLKEGWGGSVLGVRSQYVGQLFSEYNRELYGKHEDSNGKWPTYDTSKRPPLEWRPFYLYCFSPDPVKLNTLTEKLKAKLIEICGPDNKDLVRELPLSTCFLDSSAVEVKADLSKGSLESSEVGRSSQASPPLVNLWIDSGKAVAGKRVECLVQIQKLVWSPRTEDIGTIKERAKLLDWKLEPVYARKEGNGGSGEASPYADVRIERKECDDQGNWNLTVSAGWSGKPLKPGWRTFRLEGRLLVDRETPPWVKAWSTDRDDVERNGKLTFRLKEALGGLWNNPALCNQTVVPLYLNVGPR